MEKRQPQTIHIAPMARRNHVTFIVAGLFMSALGLVALQWQYSMFGYLALMPGIVLVLLGLFKWQEPKVSFVLSPQGFCWRVRHGEVLIEWSNIIGLSTLQVNKGQGKTELHYLGLKLWNREAVIQTISLRAAKSLFHEYRSLLHVALMEAQYRGDDVQQLQEDTETWRGDSGQRFDGLKGMFAARLAQLKMFLGADLYIPVTSLDRHQDEFIELFTQYQRSIQQLAQEQQLND
ncbi:DUF2982 domain-containing protein [Pleionea litopenaei]|uniref:DUF2982 domain-containing protein n=1 Tax=Pleionea litopenaei TaxID=3070815 RepID=A0AA51X7I3_9GAMM|nr:DUF2982 domain-containing protein [Pleionea sp. HL-JVS1]WMS87145.1 DUF2982 domain-containing protein [Pleionea sp. HL-JVS1]